MFVYLTKYDCILRGRFGHGLCRRCPIGVGHDERESTPPDAARAVRRPAHVSLAPSGAVGRVRGGVRRRHGEPKSGGDARRAISGRAPRLAGGSCPHSEPFLRTKSGLSRNFPQIRALLRKLSAISPFRPQIRAFPRMEMPGRTWLADEWKKNSVWQRVRRFAGQVGE